MLWGPHEEVLGLVRRQRDGGGDLDTSLSCGVSRTSGEAK